ncbi:uncharacterized protein si:ch211-106e7.2 [Tachysurus fulvidraco]|uniref:uncharacterized protein si:ch211-106e7.2 n=1 Tax=Tachysurus fulvidraco TaxID=1234273 RepID=UPI001FEDF909|nr:uncharacterized protein si:ch211-106e7.2 [Tachysurus fulvidraco]XP_027029125.2 uncharacterized protein si:ch211-106e7.2 [Tachysurus fulvidraco]
MEKLAASGTGTSAHLSQTSNYITIPLDTIIKDQKILSYGGPTAFKSGWKQTSPLQTSNEQILTQNQQNNESYLRQSTVSFYRPTGQSGNSFPPVLPNANYPQHNSQHFCSNARPPEISVTGEKVLGRQCPIQSSSSSVEYQKASLALKTPNSSQQSHIPSMFVLNANNLSGSWKNNLFNQQQHVNITNNLPKDSISQGLLTGFILAQAPVITLQPLTNKIQTNETPLHQQNACLPKDIYQQRYATQKAIAVVTPLTQVAVAGVTLSNNLAEVKEGDPQGRFVSSKNDHQPSIPQTCQSTTNESGAKSLNDPTIQTKEVPLKSVLAPGLFHRLKDDGPAQNNKLPGLSERLVSVSLNSMRVQRMEEVQQPITGDDSSVKLLRDNDATVMSSNSVGTNTRMNARMDTLSTIPVQEWSLQRLHESITQMEQTQKSQQKDLPYDNLFDEILKLYWNGDYKKLCNAAKSNVYKDIIKDVRLYCSTKNSVILQGVSKERLNEIASSVHILEHGTEPPKMGYTSSWLNLNENLHDIDKEHGYLSTLMTLQSKNKIAGKEAPVKELENRPELSKEKLKASDKALSGREEQRKPLPPEHHQNSCVQDDKTVRKDPVDVNVEKMCSEKVIEGQNSTNVKNVISESIEQQNKTMGENQAPLLTSSTKPETLFKLLSRDTTPVLDKDDSVKMSILPLEKAEEPNVDNMIKEDAQILTDSSQVTVELFEDKKCIDMEIKSDEMSKGIKINWKLEKYCCLPKWLQVLGYRNEGLCKCEKRSELSNRADASGEGVKEVNADQNRYPFNKACKLNDTDICELRDSKQAKNDKNGQKNSSVTSPVVDDGSMDELEIVEVITNFKDVVKLAHAMSEQVKEMPLLTRTSHESTSRRDHHKECKTGETLRNLVLFGTSNVRHGKNMSSDKMHLPPETVNIRIDSVCNENPNSSKSPKSHTSKQQVWNSWKKAHVFSATTPYRRSKRQKQTKAPASKSDENTSCLTSADKQKNTNGDQSKKKSRKKISLTRQDQIRKLKRNKMLASINLKKRRNYAHHGSKHMKSSLDSAQVINPSKKKLNTGLALNFGVLPDSFNMSDDGSSVKANQSASAESSLKDKTVVRIKRTWGMSGTWCESPKKKQCLGSVPTLTNSSKISTFQEFKKKYEEKRQKITI